MVGLKLTERHINSVRCRFKRANHISGDNDNNNNNNNNNNNKNEIFLRCGTPDIKAELGMLYKTEIQTTHALRHLQRLTTTTTANNIPIES